MNERIKEVRKMLHLTQSAFAGRVGVKQQTIAMLEAGNSNPSEQLINGICREFRVNEAWLRTGEGEMFIPAPSSTIDRLCEEYDLDTPARIVLEKFVELPPEEQQAIIGYMCSVVDTIRAEKTEAEKLHDQLDAQLEKEKEAAEKSEA